MSRGLQHADLLAQLHAHFGVQGGKRLIEQEDPRLDRQGPRQGHALLLAAGHLVGVLGRFGSEPDQLQLFHGPGPTGLARHLAHAQPEGHVLPSRHVGEEAVALEHHAHVAPLGRNAGLVHPVDENPARIDRFEAGQDPQSGGLATARRPEEGHQFPRLQGQGEPVERLRGAETAAQPHQFDGRTALLGRDHDQTFFRAWAIRRIRRRSKDEITIKTSQVTTSDNNETAVETCPSSWAKL